VDCLSVWQVLFGARKEVVWQSVVNQRMIARVVSQVEALAVDSQVADIQVADNRVASQTALLVAVSRATNQAANQTGVQVSKGPVARLRWRQSSII
jgi:hypothetical protein